MVRVGEFALSCLSFHQIFENMEEKVYLIVKNQEDPKVLARVFKTQEKAEKVLNERDERTGERLYPQCRVIERTLE